MKTAIPSDVASLLEGFLRQMRSLETGLGAGRGVVARHHAGGMRET